jgi:hypothetical protein
LSSFPGQNSYLTFLRKAITSSKQKSSSKINKAPSAQPVHAFQSSLPDINPKYFSPPGGKQKRLASPPRIARSGSVLTQYGGEAVDVSLIFKRTAELGTL